MYPGVAPQIAQRMHGIAPFRVMQILARAQALEAAGRDIVHLEIGEPDFATPRPVCQAGTRAMESGELFYTPALGLPQLREAISGFYQTRYGVSVAPERIIVTTGSSGALMLVMAALLNAGDEVLMADPGYPANRHFVRLMDGVARGIAVGAESHYQLTAEMISRQWGARTVAALVATPSNPTGTIIEHAEIHRMAEAAATHGGALIVDEIYHGLVYEGDTRTAADVGANVFVINSFSKYFNMTGWRLGWMIAPERYVPVIDRLAQNVFLCAPATAQLAALAALTDDTYAICDARREEFRARRDYLVPALRELGFIIPHTPNGAFYIYANCSHLTRDSESFALALLEQAGVAITPGIDFGEHRAHEHVRFAYTRPIERLREGVRRIATFLQSSQRG